MSQTWKIVVAVVITAVIVGGGMYIWQQKEISNQIQKIESATQQGSATTPEGISFTYPTEWHVDTEQKGNVYVVYRNNPDLTVTFKTFADKGSWQKRIDEWKDEIKSEKDARIGGLSAKLLETADSSGYYSGYYYVNTGTRWFEISTADQASPEIAKIIRSVYFEDAAFGSNP